MANCIRNCPTVCGITIKDYEYILSQFADDTDIYLPYDEQVVNSVLEILTDIEMSTGLLVSYDKTTLYRIGSITNTNAKFYTIRPVRWTNDPVNTLGIDLHEYDTLGKNFESIIHKLEIISKMWYYRNITIIGKIVIVNALMSSLFIYKLQVISNIPNDLYTKFKSIVTDFLWSGKKAKIPINTLYCDYCQGGLRLANITNRHTALLSKWVFECKKDNTIANLASANICTFNNDIWLYNLNSADFIKVSKADTTNFWTHVGEAWAKIHFQRPTTREDVQNQYIALNSLIRVKNEVIKPNPKWPERISDVLTAEGEYIMYDELKIIYPQLSWLDNLTIKTAIPPEWKEAVKTGPTGTAYPNWPQLFTKKNVKASKIAYGILNDNVRIIAKTYNTWHFLLDLTDKSEMQAAFKRIRSITNIIKLRSFQFRLLHNKIFCNNVLFHWGKVPTQACEFCDCTKQTPIHLLIECPNSLMIWKSLESYLEEFGFPFKINTKSIILNSYPTDIINFFVLLIKQKIFAYKCKNELCTWGTILNEIDLMYNIELYNAVQNQKLTKHVRKWVFIKEECAQLLNSNDNNDLNMI